MLLVTGDSILFPAISLAPNNAWYRVVITIYLPTECNSRDHKCPKKRPMIQMETDQHVQGQLGFLSSSSDRTSLLLPSSMNLLMPGEQSDAVFATVRGALSSPAAECWLLMAHGWGFLQPCPVLRGTSLPMVIPLPGGSPHPMPGSCGTAKA